MVHWVFKEFSGTLLICILNFQKNCVQVVRHSGPCSISCVMADRGGLEAWYEITLWDGSVFITAVGYVYL